MLSAFVVGFAGISTEKELRELFEEKTYLDTILFWIGDSNISSLADLLAVKKLPPLADRKSRRKAKSLLMLKETLDVAAFHYLFNCIYNHSLNQVEWKVYGGVTKLGLHTDDRSPLLRGHLVEMHYGNSYEATENELADPVARKATDNAFVAKINAVGVMMQSYFGSGTLGYLGYIDDDLASPGASYFGIENTARLSALRARWDPCNILSSASDRYLFPTETVMADRHGTCVDK